MAVREPAEGADPSAHLPVAAPPAPLAPDLAQRWAIDPKYVFLNHGSFGAVPRAVRQSWIAAQDRIEARPIEMLGRRLDALLAEARGKVARFVGTSPDRLGFVVNATEGINAVLAAIDWRAGDEVVVLDQVYNAMRQSIRRLADRFGVRLVEVELPYPIARPAQIIDRVLESIGPRTRMLLIDHVTSPTAVVVPVEEIVREARARGVMTIVDGAHAPGSLPVSVDRVGAHAYVANLHKWCCAPKGAGFLAVDPALLESVHPLATSHRYREGFAREFDWQGTRDMAAWIVAGAAIDAMAEFGWDAVRRHNLQMAAWVQRMLCERWEVEPIAPVGAMLGSMCAVPLPAEVCARFRTAAEFQEALYAQDRIEVPIIEFGGRWHVRPSAQAYNRAEEYDRLARAVIEHASRA